MALDFNLRNGASQPRGSSGFEKEADLLHYAPSSRSWALLGSPLQSSPRLHCSAPRWAGCRCCCCPARCWCADAPTGSPPSKLQEEKGKVANTYMSKCKNLEGRGKECGEVMLCQSGNNLHFLQHNNYLGQGALNSSASSKYQLGVNYYLGVWSFKLNSSLKN